MNYQIQNSVTGDFYDYKNIPYCAPTAFPLEGDGTGYGYGDEQGNGETTGYGLTREAQKMKQYHQWQQWQLQHPQQPQPATYPYYSTTAPTIATY